MDNFRYANLIDLNNCPKFTKNKVEMIPTLTHYQQITAQCRALFLKKMTDYGVAWRILRLPSLTDQIFIKAQRIRSIQSLAEQKVEEGQESEFMGIVNYCIMALIQLEKELQNNQICLMMRPLIYMTII